MCLHRISYILHIHSILHCISISVMCSALWKLFVAIIKTLFKYTLARLHLIISSSSVTLCRGLTSTLSHQAEWKQAWIRPSGGSLVELRASCLQRDCCMGAVQGPWVNGQSTQGKLKRDQVSKESPLDPDRIDSRCTSPPVIDCSNKWFKASVVTQNKRHLSPLNQTGCSLRQWWWGCSELPKSRCHLRKYGRRKTTGEGVGLLIDWLFISKETTQLGRIQRIFYSKFKSFFCNSTLIRRLCTQISCTSKLATWSFSTHHILFSYSI